VTDRPRKDEKAEGERWEVLRRIEDWLEPPMVVLGPVCLAVIVAREGLANYADAP
jgi:hypothetical protein